MKTTEKQVRYYPQSCISMYCGRSGADCNDTCQYWKDLQDFKDWVKRTGAKCADEVWSPLRYEVTA